MGLSQLVYMQALLLYYLGSVQAMVLIQSLIEIQVISPWAIPLLGSCVLLASGFILTLGHHALILGSKYRSSQSLLLTVLLGAIFLLLQYNEYLNGEFTIADSVFGSVFYMTTGLHALHVIAGVVFLTVGMIRVFRDSFTTEHHLGLEFSIFYWHQVDVVWLQVFVVYYWWGSELCCLFVCFTPR